MDEHTEILADSDAVSIHSGFPSPAADRLSKPHALTLDLNRLLITSASSTYLFRITGHQWEEQGIFDGDIAVVDRAPSARPGDLVIIWQASGFAIVRGHTLSTDNPWWGVITSIIHQYR